MPRCLTCGGEQAGFAFVFESKALAVDADDNRVVQDPIEHRHSEYAVTGEGRFRRADIDEWIRKKEQTSLEKPGALTVPSPRRS
jgi:hypothetical protein